jgi:hypothetical protein
VATTSRAKTSAAGTSVHAELRAASSDCPEKPTAAGILGIETLVRCVALVDGEVASSVSQTAELLLLCSARLARRRPYAFGRSTSCSRVRRERRDVVLKVVSLGKSACAVGGLELAASAAAVRQPG